MSEARREPSTLAIAEVKSWLRNSILSPAAATPMRFLYMAYRLQGGRWSARDFSDVIVHRCPGIRTEKRGDSTVVFGVAPRWDAESLTRVIQGRQQ